MNKYRNLNLASQSPRRRQLLESVGIPFEVVERESVSLPVFRAESPGDYAIELAIRKAQAAKCEFCGLVLGCDTIVVMNGRLFEKPRTGDEARQFLSLLQDNWHDVYTGIALHETITGRTESAVEKTRVHFAPLDDEAIAAYIATGEPMDKAGAYGIQEKGALLVREIVGDYFNVVGLPLFRLTLLLKEFNIHVRDLIEGL